MKKLHFDNYLNIEHTQAKNLFNTAYPWVVIRDLKNRFHEVIHSLGSEYKEIEKGIWVHLSAKIVMGFSRFETKHHQGDVLIV